MVVLTSGPSERFLVHAEEFCVSVMDRTRPSSSSSHSPTPVLLPLRPGPPPAFLLSVAIWDQARTGARGAPTRGRHGAAEARPRRRAAPRQARRTRGAAPARGAAGAAATAGCRPDGKGGGGGLRNPPSQRACEQVWK